METIASLGYQLSLPSGRHLLPKTSFVCKPAKQFRVKASPQVLTCTPLDGEVSNQNRDFKKLEPSQWTHYFHSVCVDVSEVNAVESEIEMLKLNMRETLTWESLDLEGEKKRILLIYWLVSLGLAYHFDEEINEILAKSFKKIEDMMVGENDLYTVSILFWVFRSYGHNMSSHVFERFQGHDGKFKGCLVEDAKGMLSLYEAANLATTTDYILDEALSFTSIHLKSLVAKEKCPLHLSTRIQNALALSQHSNMEILVAMEYIPFYEQEEDHDDMLLKFAKLNFKLLQLHYRQELKVISKWYKDHDFASKLPPYYRDRIIELHFFALAVYFEPELSSERIMLTKYLKVLTILDDTCDRYASLLEAESLANSLQRWAPDDAMVKQPEFLKFVLNFIMNVFQEFENEVRPEGRYGVEATKEEFKKLVKGNLDLTKWALASHVPSFEDYMRVGEYEVAVYATLAGNLMVMGHVVSKEAHEWLKSKPKITQLLAFNGRLKNDITGFEDDMNRGTFATGINCYMKQYGVTEKEAFRKLHEKVVEIDKTFNEELLKKHKVPRKILKTVLNVARMINVAYNENEGYTFPEVKIYQYMTSMFFFFFFFVKDFQIKKKKKNTEH